MNKQEIKPVARPSLLPEWPAQWEPFTALNRMRDNFDQMFSDLFRNISQQEPQFPLVAHIPQLDLYKSGESLVAEIAVPGLKTSEIEIQTTPDQIIVSGEYKRSEEKKTENVFRSEMAMGKFQRAIRLPYAIKTDAVKAKLDNGVLKITMPLMEPEMHKTTKVKVE
jgi:HSP20 family protein